MACYVVLLRGINVSASTRIAMSDLREVLHGAGLDDARTHLQSGNVLLSSSKKASDVGNAVETTIAKRLDMSVAAVVRTADQLRAVVEADVLSDVATDGSKRFVMFLGTPHDPHEVKQMAEAVQGRSDEVVADGREIYLWCPDGIRDSPLAKATMGKRSGPPATVRNWNTVARLAAMLDEEA